MEERIELLEEYNPEGICVKRTINGFELPTDKEPSVAIFKNISSITQKFYLTREEAEHKYGFIPSKYKI